MAVREEVSATLDALCERLGVSEDSDGDFAVVLGEVPRWVQIYDEPAARAVVTCTIMRSPRRLSGSSRPR